MTQDGPRRDLVLLGGGHTHALALRMLAMQRPPATRISLVSDTAFAPYSGMLPGLVAGHYDHLETHIDLRRFCAARDIRFIEAAATRVDPGQRRIWLTDRPPLDYDILSINIGAQPELDSVPGAREYATPVKPVSGFFTRWQLLLERVVSGEIGRGIVVVGGGAGSVELALAIRHTLGPALPVELISGDDLLKGYNGRARAAVRRALESARIGLRESCRVTRVDPDSLQTSGNETVHFDELIWCTGAVPARWLRDSGLPCDDQGFLRIDNSLLLEGESAVFAAGDCAVQVDQPRPRAGVFAVRQAPTLAHNLRASVTGQPLRKHQPQKRFLSLLSLGDRKAVADRGLFSAQGEWVWRWKDRIDRKFMAQFAERPPAMAASVPAVASPHCGGCGAKLASNLLRDVLDELQRDFPQAIRAESLREDAAVVDWPSGIPLVQSVDSLRQLVDDPWVMGRIAAVHALSDLYAMGAQPSFAQLQVCLPYAAASLQRRELYQLMSGLLQELSRAGAALVGGHSMEGPELNVGVTVNGSLPDTALPKQGGGAGDLLVLTKPLGTGVVFAGAMTGDATGLALAEAVRSMLLSNRDAAELGRQYGALAVTDVTGFGLLGHLLEMRADGDYQAVLMRNKIPLLEGAGDLLAAGIRSTLHPGNRESLPIEMQDLAEREPVLCDPQTSGGLLLVMPGDKALPLVAALAERGHQPAVIGELRHAPGGAPVTLED